MLENLTEVDKNTTKSSKKVAMAVWLFVKVTDLKHISMDVPWLAGLYHLKGECFNNLFWSQATSLLGKGTAPEPKPKREKFTLAFLLVVFMANYLQKQSCNKSVARFMTLIPASNLKPNGISTFCHISSTASSQVAFLLRCNCSVGCSL